MVMNGNNCFQRLQPLFSLIRDFICSAADLFAEQQHDRMFGVTAGMTDFDKTEMLLRALADKSRLQILGCIQNGTSNPGEIARELNRHRSTVEKHLKVLLKAKMVEKVPSLNKKGQLSITYKIRENTARLLETIREVSRQF